MGLGEGNAPGWIVPEMDVETVTAAVCGSNLGDGAIDGVRLRVGSIATMTPWR